MLEPIPARAAVPIIWVTSTGPRVGTIWFPAPVNAWDDASKAVFRFISLGMGVLTPVFCKSSPWLVLKPGLLYWRAVKAHRYANAEFN